MRCPTAFDHEQGYISALKLILYNNTQNHSVVSLLYEVEAVVGFITSYSYVDAQPDWSTSLSCGLRSGSLSQRVLK